MGILIWDQEGTTISSVSESTLVDSKAHAKAGMDPSKWMVLGVVLSTRQMAQRAEHGVVHVFLCSLASLMPLPLLLLLLLLLSVLLHCCSVLLLFVPPGSFGTACVDLSNPCAAKPRTRMAWVTMTLSVACAVLLLAAAAAAVFECD